MVAPGLKAFARAGLLLIVLLIDSNVVYGSGIPVVDGARISMAVQSMIEGAVESVKKEAQGLFELELSGQLGIGEQAIAENNGANVIARWTEAIEKTNDLELAGEYTPSKSACRFVSAANVGIKSTNYKAGRTSVDTLASQRRSINQHPSSKAVINSLDHSDRKSLAKSISSLKAMQDQLHEERNNLYIENFEKADEQGVTAALLLDDEYQDIETAFLASILLDQLKVNAIALEYQSLGVFGATKDQEVNRVARLQLEARAQLIEGAIQELEATKAIIRDNYYTTEWLVRAKYTPETVSETALAITNDQIAMRNKNQMMLLVLAAADELFISYQLLKAQKSKNLIMAMALLTLNEA